MGALVEKKYRVQLDFDQQGFDELEALKKELRASSRADTIRDALAMLQWTAKQLRNGGRILVEEKDGQVSNVFFPFLTQYSRMAEREVPQTIVPVKVWKADSAFAAGQGEEIKG
jgi:hypothetical protein